MQTWVSFQPSDMWSLNHRRQEPPFIGGDWGWATQSCRGCYKKKMGCFLQWRMKIPHLPFLSLFYSLRKKKILSLSQMSYFSLYLSFLSSRWDLHVGRTYVWVEARSLKEISSHSQFCLAWTVHSQQPFSLYLTAQQLRTPHAKTFKKPTKHLQASNKTWGQII